MAKVDDLRCDIHAESLVWDDCIRCRFRYEHADEMLRARLGGVINNPKEGE